MRKLGTLRECFYEEAELTGSRCAALGGFSLHADTACESWEREKLERLCRYVARPAIAIDRLSKRPDGLLVYKLIEAYQDGTEYLLFSPEELLEKLAVLVPIPRVHLTKFHGCLAPNAKIRAKVVRQARENPSEAAQKSKPYRRRRLSWAQLMRRVFQIDLEDCTCCGGKVKILAAILDGPTIERILGHLGLSTVPPIIHPARAPPQVEFGS